MHPIASHQIATIRMEELRREAQVRRTAPHGRPSRRSWYGLRRQQGTAPAVARPA